MPVSSNFSIGRCNTFADQTKITIMNAKILVLGGTGKTGKRVAERLWDQGLNFRIGSRVGTPAFDWNQPSTWAQVLDRIEKIYITFQPDLAVPGAVEIIRSFVDVTITAGVKKLVLLSGRGEKESQVCEKIVMDSGLDWTIVRASWFMQNFSEGFMLDSILSGSVVLPKLKASAPFVDADDIADVVVDVLMKDKHSRQIYDLTGPRLLSFQETVSIISKAVNRSISFEEASMEEYMALLNSYQVPADVIWLITYLFTEVLVPPNEVITDDIERILGRKAGSFEEYIAKTEKTGVWDLVHA